MSREAETNFDEVCIAANNVCDGLSKLQKQMVIYDLFLNLPTYNLPQAMEEKERMARAVGKQFVTSPGIDVFPSETVFALDLVMRDISAASRVQVGIKLMIAEVENGALLSDNFAQIYHGIQAALPRNSIYRR